MDVSKHCELCDNQLLDIKVGTICKLDGKKPAFNKTCIKIELNDTFKQKLETINTEYLLLKKSKRSVYCNAFIHFAISVLLIISGFLLGNYGLSKGVFATLPFIISGVGMVSIAVSFFPIKKFKQHFYVAQSNKENLDALLRLYNIRYEFKLHMGKEVHRVKEYNTELILSPNFKRGNYDA